MRPCPRALALAIILLLLAWGALPYLSGQIDDTYIVFAYAHNLLDRHAIVWNTGQRVEGYSSPLHLALMALGALAGLDLAIFARVVAIACAVLVVLRLARPSVGPGRLVLAALLAAWQPFQFWATSGLETALATLLGVLAWPLVVGGRDEWARGMVLLTVYSVTRPEGLAWLGIGLVRRLFLGRGIAGPERLVLGSLAALAAYHAARVGYFGHVLPTPYVVKVAAIHEYASGVQQAAREVASASALLAATILFRRSTSPWSWWPFLVQVALLVRAGGDWMGHARFLVPGLAASVAAAWTSGAVRRPGWLASVLVALLGVASFVVEPTHGGVVGGRGAGVSGWRNPWFLLHPLATLRTPWAVPLIEDASFLVERIPPGAGAQISDVGIPGNLADIPIWDAAGLTDRVTAEVIASADQKIAPEIEERYRSGAIWCLRYERGPDGTETASGLLLDLYPEVSPSRSKAAHLVWRCRPGGAPSPEVVAERWSRLLERYPSQDWIRWYYVRSLLAIGRAGDARAQIRSATWLAQDGLGWALFGDRPGGGYQVGRGWAQYQNGALASLSLEAELWSGVLVFVDVDDPGPEGAAVRLRWEPECGAPVEAAVHERTMLPPPACAVPGRRRLVVDFLNDEYRPNFDRNIYVGAGEAEAYPGTAMSVAPPAASAPAE